MKIEDYIPVGKENAISRYELERMTGLPDRINRRLILKARKKIVPIIASEKGGYYITYDISEIEAFLKTIDSRIDSMVFTYLPLRRMVQMSKGVTVTKVRALCRRLSKTAESTENQLKMNGVN